MAVRGASSKYDFVSGTIVNVLECGWIRAWNLEPAKIFGTKSKHSKTKCRFRIPVGWKLKPAGGGRIKQLVTA